MLNPGINQSVCMFKNEQRKMLHNHWWAEVTDFYFELNPSEAFSLFKLYVQVFFSQKIIKQKQAH